MMLNILITSFLLIGSCYLTVSLDPQCHITNLAVNKTSAQSTTYDDKSKANYTSGKAVDGNFTNGESRTIQQINQWLRVDLSQSHPIGVVELYAPKISRISLLTSNDASVSAPTLNPGQWTERAYREDVDGEAEIIQLQSISARHLAIFSTGTLGISLVEMMVFSDMCYNLAEVKVSSQNTTMRSNVSKYGNDGCLSTLSITAEEDRQYWMVALGVKHVIYKIVLHTKASSFEGQYGNWAIITNVHHGVPGPNCTGDKTKREWSGGWQEVYFMSTTNETNDLSFPSVSAQHVAVFNVNNGKGILLRELQVFGCQCELQELVRQYKIKPSKTAGCVTLSWNITHPYCSTSEFEYKYQCQDEGSWVSTPYEFSGDVCYSTFGTLVTCDVSACLGSYCYSKQIHASTSPAKYTERYLWQLICVCIVAGFLSFVTIRLFWINTRNSLKNVCKQVFFCSDDGYGNLHR